MRFWLVCAAFILVCAAALTEARRHYRLAFNLTDSMDGTLFLVERVAEPELLRRGDIAVFALDGSRWGYPAEALWAKRIVGLPGESIEVRAASVWVAGEPVAVIDADAMERGRLSPVTADSVPPESFFVLGDNRDSLDSRYAEFGFPARADLEGVASRLW